METTVKVVAEVSYPMIICDSAYTHGHIGAMSRKRCLTTFGGGFRFGLVDLEGQEGALFFGKLQAEELHTLLSKAKELNWF